VKIYFYDEKSSKPNSFLCWHYLICDDGNLTQEAINFEDITTQSCNTNDVVIQIKGSLTCRNSKFLLQTDFFDRNTTILDINSSNRVVYRFYNGTVSMTIFAKPYLRHQRSGTSGMPRPEKINIYSTVKTKSMPRITVRISGYNHNITQKKHHFHYKVAEL
jgi:hypothetical protein